MASLVRRKNGTYYAQWTDVQRTPQRRRLSLKTKGKRVAQQLLSELDDAYRLGGWDPWLRTVEEFYDRPRKYESFSDVLGLFLTEKRKEGLSGGTLKLYKSDLKNLAGSVGPNKLLEQLTAAQIDAFVRAESIARTTQRKRHRVVRAFLNWATRAGHLQDNPIGEVKSPKPVHQFPRAVKPADLEKICEVISIDYASKLRDDRGVIRGSCCENDLIWTIPLFWFALYTGMRISEIARLRWKHIDRTSKLIYIVKQKNGKQQTIPLNRMAAEVLETIAWGTGEEFVFRSPRGHTAERSTAAFINRVTSLFTRYRRAAGIKRKLTFHGLRHGHCTMLAEAGKSAVVIKASARHAHVQTSMRYVAIANEHLKSELDDVFCS